jgi:hypothetical protein
MEAACEGKRVVATAGQEVDVGAAEKSEECGDEALREVVCSEHAVVVVAKRVPAQQLQKPRMKTAMEEKSERKLTNHHYRSQ